MRSPTSGLAGLPLIDGDSIADDLPLQRNRRALQRDQIDLAAEYERKASAQLREITCAENGEIDVGVAARSATGDRAECDDEAQRVVIPRNRANSL